MLAKGCPLCFSKDVLAEIFCNVRGWADGTEGYIVVRAKTMIKKIYWVTFTKKRLFFYFQVVLDF